MKPDLADLLILVGAILVVVGMWQVYPPAAIMAGGAILMALGLAMARHKSVVEFKKRRGE